MLRALIILAVVAVANACIPCTCGLGRNARVVGGEAALPGEFPFLAALKRDGKVVCGATIVSNDHLITATHCVNNIEESRLSVIVGEYDVNNTLAEGFKVQRVIQHPDFNSNNFDNDIAVLRLAEPLPEHLARTACLPDVGDQEMDDNAELTVAGWGKISENGPSSHIPLKAKVKVWPLDDCIRSVYGKGKVTSRMLCAYAPDIDACGGDSGGPLLHREHFYTVVGIVSWGRGCGRPGYPGVYTRVDRFLPWLQGALRHACTCEPPTY